MGYCRPSLPLPSTPSLSIENVMSRTRRIGLLAFLGLIASAFCEQSHADMFFSQRDFIEVELRLDGKPLTEPGVRAALLSIAPIFRDGDDESHGEALLPGLETMPWVDVLGARWSRQGYLVGGVCAQGRVKFEGLAVAAGFPEAVE